VGREHILPDCLKTDQAGVDDRKLLCSSPSDENKYERVGTLTRGASTQQGVLQPAALRAFAGGRRALLAEAAFPAGNLEGGDNTVFFLQISHNGSHFVDNTAELVS
jgi:hypothetical protein